MDNVINLIKKRTSVRTYTKISVEQSKRDALSVYFETAAQNPFGAKVRFALLDSDSTPRKIGTYGFIKGAKTFVAGCVKKGGRDMEGFGYAFEQAVLFATQQGLGTCWLGGTLSRGAYAKAMGLSGEILPAVSPIGYAAQKQSRTEKMVAKRADARNRIAFDELFFGNEFGTPMASVDTRIKTCLDMVRIAPSASNKQPWRVVRRGGAYHFYLAKSRGYSGNNLLGFYIQRIDMGIAACHFALTARELGVPGGIVTDDPGLLSAEQMNAGIEYSFSWI